MKEKYLLLTALTDLWNIEENTVFIGPWCIRESNKEIYERMNGHVIDEERWYLDWDTNNAMFLNFQHLVFPYVIEELNTRNHVNHGEIYWNTFLNEWMRQWYETWNNVYYALRMAIERNPGCKVLTYRLSETKIPISIQEFDAQNWNVEYENRYDFFHILLYNEVLKFLQSDSELSFSITYKECPYSRQKSTVCESGDSVSTLKRVVDKLYYSFSKKASIVYGELHVSDYRRFKIRTLKKAVVISLNRINGRNKDTLFNRSEMKLNVKSSDRFENFLIERFFWDLPELVLEKYKDSNRELEAFLKWNPKFFVVNKGCDILGLLAASWREQGTKIIGVAHSPGQSMFNCFCRDGDRKVEGYDLYYTWGDSGYSNAMMSPTYKYVPARQAAYSKKNILWCFSGIEENRYPDVWFTALGIRTSEDVKKRVSVIERFARNINEVVSDEIRYRMRDPWRMGMENILLKYNPLVKADEEVKETVGQPNGGLLSEKIYGSKLVICNSLFTSVFIEALVRNVPVIVLQPEMDEKMQSYLWDDIKEWCERLKQQGIWFTDGKLAADFINCYYDKILDWWMEPKRQKIVKEFGQRVYRTTEDDTCWWIEETKRMIKV